MTKPPKSAEDILADPEYQKKRNEYDNSLKAVWDARRLEAKTLLDELKKFNLHYKCIHELVGEPENTFILVIGRMVEYLDVFEDLVNREYLTMILARPEGTGLVAKPMIELYKSTTKENLKFQASKAILATAELDDVAGILKLLFDEGASVPEKVMFLRAIVKLKKKESLPTLVRCLSLEDVVVIEALKSWRKLKLSGDCTLVKNLQSRNDAKIRKLARALS